MPYRFRPKSISMFWGLLCGLTFLILFRLSFLKWADPQVDFARDFQVAARLATGETLYRNVFYFNGPLSPWINATVFRFFGASLHTLFALNFAVLVLIMWASYRFLRQMASPDNAAFTLWIFILLFPFGFFSPYNIFNYIAPYSHEMTHSLLVGWGLLGAWLHALRRDNIRSALLAGGLLVLLFLLKTEMALAGTLLSGIAAVAAIRLRGFRPALRGTLAGFVVGFSGLAGLCWLTMSFAVDSDFASLAFIEPWKHVLNQEVRSLLFYKSLAGLHTPAASLFTMLSATAALAALLLIPVLILRKSTHRVFQLMALILPPLLVLIWALTPPPSRLAFPLKALPLLLTFYLIIKGLRFLKHPSQTEIPSLLLAAFSLALLPKIILRTDIYIYGFVLAMPAFLWLIVSLVDEFPRIATTKTARPQAHRASLMTLLAIYALAHLPALRDQYAESRYVINAGRNSFTSDARTAVFAECSAWLRENTPENSTLLPLTEGFMLNLLSGRPNPTPLMNLMPPEYIMHGEALILEVLRNNPPDWIALVDKDTRYYGYAYFGTHYGQAVMQWIREHYEPVAAFGDPPFQGKNFGILVVRYRPTSTLSPPPAQ